MLLRCVNWSLVAQALLGLVTSSAYCQSNWVFEREDVGGASLFLAVYAESPSGYNTDATGFLTPTFDNVLVQDGVSASSHGDSYSAVSNAVGSASVLTAVGSQTFVPTVSTTLSEGYAATGPAAGASAGTGQGTTNAAISTGTFGIRATGPAVNAWFHGSLYLTAIPLYLGNSPGMFDTTSGITFVRADINGWYAQATWDQFEMNWNVIADLPGGITTEMDVAGVNHFFDFVVPITVGVSDFTFTAQSEFLGRAITDGFNSLSSINAGFSASAWGVITPIGESPLMGDFDGDGNVDDDDLITGWQVNFGTNINTGATVTLSRGDADHDGDVDGIDFLAWQRGFGSSYSTSSGSLESAIRVPEPSTTTLAMLCGIAWCFMTSCRDRKNATYWRQAIA